MNGTGIEQGDKENIQESLYCLKRSGRGSASANSGTSLSRKEIRNGRLEYPERLDLETGIVDKWMFPGSLFSLVRYCKLMAHTLFVFPASEVGDVNRVDTSKDPNFSDHESG
ncbi:hypothetical protein SAY87_030240 [Trapa incisa]|uniref:Uncharacterized protein n=1 Tax=Trapa incisa TaxID=236973 RepID=A0AAN7KIA0_9MYRT|nr:hypothetical protein SAY87_030240 [Trapa incisa]